MSAYAVMPPTGMMSPEAVTDGEDSSARTLGDSLIPIINKLQDIFNQVRQHALATLDLLRVSSILQYLLTPHVSPKAATVASHEGPILLTPCFELSCWGCLQVTVDLKLNLPQVAVVGSQSSGKSSVLEALVRRAEGLAAARA